MGKVDLTELKLAQLGFVLKGWLSLLHMQIAEASSCAAVKPLLPVERVKFNLCDS